MDLIVTAILTLLGAIGAYFGVRSKFTQRGYDQASNHQKIKATETRKALARKDAEIDQRVQTNHVKIKANAQARLQENTGKAANSFIARSKKKWQLRDNK